MVPPPRRSPSLRSRSRPSPDAHHPAPEPATRHRRPNASTPTTPRRRQGPSPRMRGTSWRASRPWMLARHEEPSARLHLGVLEHPRPKIALEPGQLLRRARSNVFELPWVAVCIVNEILWTGPCRHVHELV